MSDSTDHIRREIEQDDNEIRQLEQKKGDAERDVGHKQGAVTKAEADHHAAEEKVDEIETQIDHIRTRQAQRKSDLDHMVKEMETAEKKKR